MDVLSFAGAIVLIGAICALVFVCFSVGVVAMMLALYAVTWPMRLLARDWMRKMWEDD